MALKRPDKKTKDGKLYDRLWVLCKERRIEAFTYKGPGKWLILYSPGGHLTETNTDALNRLLR